MLRKLGLDYFFITRRGVKVRKEIEEDYSPDADGEAKLDDDRSNGTIVKAIVVRRMATKA